MGDYRRREKRIDKHAGLKRCARISRSRGEHTEKPLTPRCYSDLDDVQAVQSQREAEKPTAVSQRASAGHVAEQGETNE